MTFRSSFGSDGNNINVMLFSRATCFISSSFCSPRTISLISASNSPDWSMETNPCRSSSYFNHSSYASTVFSTEARSRDNVNICLRSLATSGSANRSVRASNVRLIPSNLRTKKSSITMVVTIRRRTMCGWL